VYCWKVHDPAVAEAEHVAERRIEVAPPAFIVP
jgi:hypothetical protein